MTTYILIGVIALLAALSIRKIIKGRMLSRCAGCSGDCSCCNIKNRIDNIR